MVKSTSREQKSKYKLLETSRKLQRYYVIQEAASGLTQVLFRIPYDSYGAARGVFGQGDKFVGAARDMSGVPGLDGIGSQINAKTCFDKLAAH